MAKILIVDDVEDNIKLLLYNLEDDGHEIISARNGLECLTQAETHLPDAILLDMMIPGMSGIETLSQLKQNPALKDIPVIMVSANDGDEAIIDALDIGAQDYITKPFIYQVLAARLRSALRLKESQEKLAAANQILARLASLDPLTEAYNHRHFFNLSGAECAKAKRFNRPISVIMIDADLFKKINDNFGHPMGDEALKSITHVCRETLRESDLLGRLGGEEFAVCCPDTDLGGATVIAERIREKIASNTVTLEDQSVQFTVSIGVTCMQADDDAFNSVLNRADHLLYEAKESGRNRVVSR